MSLIRLNLNEAAVPEGFGSRAVGINEDMEKSISDLLRELTGDALAKRDSESKGTMQ